MATIGFVSNLYGRPKGHSYVVRDMLRILIESGHETHMYRIGDNPIPAEFVLPTTLNSWSGRDIPDGYFENWLAEVEPDWCVFTEYWQWWQEGLDKVATCTRRGIRTAGFLVHEMLHWSMKSHYNQYNVIISPTCWQTQMMREGGLCNVVHVPWGVDIKEIDAVQAPARQPGTEDKLVFYHCAGGGGRGDRKNTAAVIEAYDTIKGENTDLIVTHLKSRVFSRDEILSCIKYSDVLVNTSKWDTIGLNTIEANACGRPALVCDAEPMNEIVVDGANGLLVASHPKKETYIECQVNEVDVEDLANKMRLLKDARLLGAMKTACRAFAETHFDWEKNKDALLAIFAAR